MFGYNDCECEQYQSEYQKLLVEEQENRQSIIDEINRQRVKTMIRQSGLGARFAERTFETYRAETEWQKTALRIAQEFCQNMVDRTDKGQGIILSGSVGTGKTHLAAAITIKVIHANFDVIYGTATALLSEIKRGWKEDDAADFVDRLCEIPLLVIDDLGKEYSKKNDGWSWAQEQFFQVINARYENYLPMIITTNLDMKQLSATMGDAIVSRIIECCRGVRCDGADYRMKKWVK